MNVDKLNISSSGYMVVLRGGYGEDIGLPLQEQSLW